MKRFQSICLATAAALSVAALTGRAAQAAAGGVFDEVPSNALAVFETRNIDQLNTKWGKFTDASGLSKLSPNIKDPLAYFQGQSGITAGMNTAGDFATVIFQTGDADPTTLVLVPVSDYKAFLGNFTAAAEDADGVTVTKAKDGSDACIAHWGEYAAVAETKDLVAKKPQGIKLQGLAAGELKKDDAIVYFNMDQVRTEELPKLQKNRDKIIEKMARGKMVDTAMAKLGWNLILDQSEEFLKDADSAVLTMNVSDDGISLGSAADFKAGTSFSQFAAAMKGTDQPLLSGLPDKKYLMLFGEALSPELKQQLQTMVLDPVLKKLDSTDPKQKSLADALAAGKAKLAATDNAAGGLVAPTGNPGQDSMIQLVAAITGDAAGWKKAELAGLQSAGDASKNADPNTPSPMTIDVKPDATTVGDVHFDQFTIKPDFSGAGHQAMQAQGAYAMLFGAKGATGYIGTASDKVALFAMGVDDQGPLMADAIAAAKSGKDVMSAAKSVQGISGQLPSPRVAEGFVYLGQIVGVAVHYAQGMGLGVHFKMPADVDPIGFALSGDGTTVRTTVLIPESLVQGIAGVINAMKNGGGGGGGRVRPGEPLPGGQGM